LLWPIFVFTTVAKPVPRLSPEEIRSVIALAWDDRPPFAAVMNRHGLSPGQVVQLLKRELTPNAFKIWTARTRSKPAAAPARPARRPRPP
jgi:uncharacterized protein (TIGR03643 family)